MIKKTAVCLLALTVIITIFTACSLNHNPPRGEELRIISTIFPSYDWLTVILGERINEAELTLLLDSGVDLHNYQPSTDDIIKISSCDLFVYVGGESDSWVEDVLKTAVNKEMIVVDLVEVLGDAVKAEEVKEGMQHDDDNDDHDDHDDDHDHSHEGEWDEHVWLSLKNAQRFTTYLAACLAELDATNAGLYKSNAEQYNSRLKALDKLYEDTVEAATFDTLIFADRFPFRYLVDDYNLNYEAAFPGCSAETEASFETIAFLTDKLNSLGLKCIMTIEYSDESIAKTVIQNTISKDHKILALDSLQSVIASDIKAGITYLSIMESNLEVLKEALIKEKILKHYLREHFLHGGVLHMYDCRKEKKMPLLTCQNLSLGYDGKAIVEKLSFTVNQGDYLCIVGENGSGKSTLIKTVLSLIPPIEGQVLLGDGLKERKIGYLPQQTVVQRDFPASVAEIVLSGCLNRCGNRPFYRRSEKQLAHDNMKKLGIFDIANRSYRELSGGQQQRVLLARALCATGQMLLLDEPAAGLDPRAKEDLYRLIEKLNSTEGITVVMISHDIGPAAKYASHILHIGGGSSLFFGCKREYAKSGLWKAFGRADGGEELWGE